MNGLEALQKASNQGLRYKAPGQKRFRDIDARMFATLFLLQEGWEVEEPLREYWIVERVPHYTISFKSQKDAEKNFKDFGGKIIHVKEVRD